MPKEKHSLAVDLPPFPRAADLLLVLPFKKSWLWQASRTGRFPRPFKLTERTTVWHRDEVLAWLDQRSSIDRGDL